MTSCAFQGTTSTFTYGADGLRRQATVNGVTTDYVYDGQTLIREGFASGGTLSTVKATYLQGPRGTECRIDETQQTEGYYDPTTHALKGRGVTKWYVYDGLGSVVGETDFNGNLTSSPKYDVYGLVRSNTGTASSAMGFVGGLGHLSEASTGLIYMRARYYDPSLGRFESEDPSKDGGNWFMYAGNNPVNNVDVTGKKVVNWLIAIGSIVLFLGALILALAWVASSGVGFGAVLLLGAVCVDAGLVLLAALDAVCGLAIAALATEGLMVAIGLIGSGLVALGEVMEAMDSDTPEPSSPPSDSPPTTYPGGVSYA